MRILFPVVVATIALAAGCASEAPAPQAQASANTVVASAAPASAPQQVCHRELPTGSNIPKTVCESAMSDNDRAMQQQQLQQNLNQMNSANFHPPGH